MEPKKVVKYFTISMFLMTFVIVGMNYVSDETAEDIYSQYQNVTQRYNNITASIVSDELQQDANQPQPQPPGLQPQPGNHEHVAFKQSEEPWGSYMLYDGTISGSGCGMCSAAAAVNYWGIDMEPHELAEFVETQRPGTIYEIWEGTDGMRQAFPGYLIDCLNKSGLYGTFNMEYKLIKSKENPLTNEEFEDVCKYLEDPNTVIMASTSTGLFTDGGHIICLLDYADDTKTTIHIADSSGVAKGRMGISWEEAQKVAFPVNDPNANVYGWKGTNLDSYKVKYVWVLKKTS